MNTEQMTSLAISLAILWGAFKFGPAAVKGAAIAVGGVIVAKRIPYLQDNL